MDHAYRYLAGTTNYRLIYDGNTFDFHGYTDADWAECYGPDDIARRSTSGYTFQMCNASVSWSSKLQSTVAKSSTEAEVIASNHAGMEAIWIRKLLKDLRPIITPTKLKDQPISTTTIYADNQPSITISTEPGSHQRTKHYDVAYFWIREKIESCELKLPYKSTYDMTADIFTKSLAKPAHDRHTKTLGLRPYVQNSQL
jgi:hypothetical protein